MKHRCKSTGSSGEAWKKRERGGSPRVRKGKAFEGLFGFLFLKQEELKRWSKENRKFYVLLKQLAFFSETDISPEAGSEGD